MSCSTGGPRFPCVHLNRLRLRTDSGSWIETSREPPGDAEQIHPGQPLRIVAQERARADAGRRQLITRAARVVVVGEVVDLEERIEHALRQRMCPARARVEREERRPVLRVARLE